MKINIIIGDITESDCDAIVNAANKELRGGSGVCGAIFKKAGWDILQKECYEKGPIKTGEAIETKGYNLKAKYIIHTAGPIYFNYSKEESKRLLSNSYLNSLKLADRLGLKSIAFPSISTGVYGYPVSEASKIALDVINNYKPINLEEVEIVCFDKNTFDEYKKNAH